MDRGFQEVHTQNRLSILAACEDPTTVATYEYAGEVWPLPQTGQMWLEYELLNNPKVPGFFVSRHPTGMKKTLLKVDMTLFFLCLNLSSQETSKI